MNKTVPASFIKKTALSSSNYLGLFAENQLTMYLCIYFWILYSVPLVYVPIHLPVPHCLHYSSFLVKYQIVWVLQLCSSFLKRFCHSIYLLFSVNFRTSLSNPTKNWDSDWDYFVSRNQFRKTVIKNIESSKL